MRWKSAIAFALLTFFGGSQVALAAGADHLTPPGSEDRIPIFFMEGMAGSDRCTVDNLELINGFGRPWESDGAHDARVPSPENFRIWFSNGCRSDSISIEGLGGANGRDRMLLRPGDAAMYRPSGAVEITVSLLSDQAPPSRRLLLL